MNKKRLTLIVTLVCMLLFLTGCTINENLIDLDTKFGQMTSEGFLSAILVFPLAQLINLISSKLGVFWGIAIVATALNAIIVVCTFKSNVAMQRMQEVQPEVQRIQLKYEGRNDNASKQRMSAELQSLYKKYDINPLGSLLATFIQFPILFAMYAAVRRSYAVANGEFLGAKLSYSPSEAFSNHAWVLLVIYVLMIILQFVSTSIPRWVQIAREKKEAELHHKHYEKPANPNGLMMYSMVVFIGIIMLSWPTALSLYYAIYSCINIVKTIVIDKITHKND